jgi:hypothetical protein
MKLDGSLQFLKYLNLGHSLNLFFSSKYPNPASLDSEFLQIPRTGGYYQNQIPTLNCWFFGGSLKETKP